MLRTCSYNLRLNPALERVFRPYMSEIIQEYQNAARTIAEHAGHLDVMLNCLLANLVAADLRLPGMWVAVIAGRDWYQANRHWQPEFVTQASVSRCSEFLVAKGLVQRDPGVRSRSTIGRRPAAIRPTDKFRQLIACEAPLVTDLHQKLPVYTIRLRAPKAGRRRGNLVQFDETTDTARMRRNLDLINATLLQNWLDIRLTKSQMRRMRRLQVAKAARGAGGDQDMHFEPGPVDLLAKPLYRVFNNGTFEQGGRFYGPWWQSIPSDYRTYITIKGEHTVEVDFSAIHPTILYHELGIPMPQHPYLIGFGNKDSVKQTFNALINAKSMNIRPVSEFDEQKFGMTWKVFLARVKAHFVHFRVYFGTGIGLKLQRLDSDVAEYVMLHFAKRGIAVLPVHDSFIVQERYSHELVQVMKQGFKELTMAKAGVHKDRLK
jgi:DNA-binding MarR family transcriptional regulator